MTLAIGVDIGGTKAACGVVCASGEALTHLRRETPADDTYKAFDRIIDMVQQCTGSYTVEAVGIGAAGWIDSSRANVMFSPNLAWRNEPLRESVSQTVGLPVVVENDGNAAAWAEFMFGAGRDISESMVLITVGTGIGGGVILGGQLLRGAHGVAGELGHTRALPGGLPCGCGRYGCLEQYASGKALVRYAKQAAIEDPASAEILLDFAEGMVAAINGPMVTRAAQVGDPASIRAFGEVGRWLGSAIADIVQSFDPGIVVLGGGVADAGDLLLAPTQDAYYEALSHRGRMPVAELVAAELGNTAGLIGAADLARRR